MRRIRSLLQSDTAQSMTEYIVIVAVVVVIAIAAYGIFGGKIKEAFTNAGEEIMTAGDEVDIGQ